MSSGKFAVGANLPTFCYNRNVRTFNFFKIYLLTLRGKYVRTLDYLSSKYFFFQLVRIVQIFYVCNAGYFQ